MSTQNVNDGFIGIVFSLVFVSLKEFGMVGSDTYTWGMKDFHKCWSGSLAKRRLCLGPTSVINCTPLSALSWVSLFHGTCGYNTINLIFFSETGTLQWKSFILIDSMWHYILPNHSFSSVAQSCLTLCDPMNCSMPGLPVHHQLPEFTQTHDHQVSDAIQPSHPLLSSSPATNPSQS